MADDHDNILEYSEEQHQVAKHKRQLEQKLRILEIASNCSVPGETSSRTIERAEEFKKYIQSND
jgi:hypothetical protein